MTGIVNQMRGKIEVELEGTFPERFLNLCAQNGVAFWGVIKLDETRVRVTMFTGGLKKFSAEAGRAGCSIKVLSQRGAPFFFKSLRGRVALWAGLLAFLLTVFITNKFIWEFEVEGNRTISDGVILESLREIGVDVGTYAGSINMTEIKNRMILRLDALSWIGVNVKGGKAVVTVRERVPTPEIVRKDIPCDIAAIRDGVVVRIDTFAGSAQVQPGQTVRRGQTLVSGAEEIPNIGTRFTHAQAHVQARTWRDITAVTLASTSKKTYTGRTQSRNALIFAGRRVNLYSGGSENYEYCDKISTQNILKLPGGIVFPVTLVTDVYKEYTIKPAEQDEGMCKALLRETLEGAVYASLNNGEISSINTVYEKKEDLLGARLTAECLEDIALTLEIYKYEGETHDRANN